jgi:hypothetical protein
MASQPGTAGPSPAGTERGTGPAVPALLAVLLRRGTGRDDLGRLVAGRAGPDDGAKVRKGSCPHARFSLPATVTVLTREILTVEAERGVVHDERRTRH